jgi:Fe-S-cluster containining protein
MAFDALKKKFPEEGHLCKKLCGKCCVATAPVEGSEAEAIGAWLCANKQVEDIQAQFHHFDDNPKQCPFLTPEKGCFIYPVRPVVCVMFGHLPDTPGQPARISQQCPEGVKFTQVSLEQTLPESMDWYMQTKESTGRMIMFRMASLIVGDDEEVAIPPKPGSIFEKMRNSNSCFKCNVEFPKGSTAYLQDNEILCPECHAKL